MLNIKSSDDYFLANLWIKNAVIALTIAGIYSLVLVILRTPQIANIFGSSPDITKLFSISLVVHVNLSVFVWLLAITAVIWSYPLKGLNYSVNQNSTLYFVNKQLAIIAIIGITLIAISPFTGETSVVKSNYIPMLENIFFIIGLTVFGVSILFFAIYTAVISTQLLIKINLYKKATFQIKQQYNNILLIVKFTSSVIFILVWVCFIISLIQINGLINLVPLEVDFYYEMLYWSGGHLLQFVYTQIFMFVLYLLANHNIKDFGVISNNLNKKHMQYIFILHFIFAISGVLGHIFYDLSESQFKDFFTMHMKYVGSVMPVIFITFILYDFYKNFYYRYKIKLLINFASVSIFASIILFLFGCIIGITISGINVTIPAHYHGVIVSITTAFMGLVYLHCYNSGLLRMRIDIAKYQIFILLLGQIIHISALALAGGYNVMRKTPDNANFELCAKIYMGIMGFGGITAIIGGLIFCYIAIMELFFPISYDQKNSNIK